MSTRNLTYFHEAKDAPPFACLSTKGERSDYGHQLYEILAPVLVRRGLDLAADEARAVVLNGMGSLACYVVASLWVREESPALVPLKVAEWALPVQDWVYRVWPEADVRTADVGFSCRVGVSITFVDRGGIDEEGVVGDGWWG